MGTPLHLLDPPIYKLAKRHMPYMCDYGKVGIVERNKLKLS